MGGVSGSTKAPPAEATPTTPRILDPLDRHGVLSRALDPHVDMAMELVDRLAGEVVLRHAAGRVALDLGHGAPRVTEWVQPRAGALTVVDAVDLGRGAEIRLPIADASFELVYILSTLPHLPHAFDLDDHHHFETGRPLRVCGNTADMLGATRYARHFRIDGDKQRHFGLFDCAPDTRAATDAGGACC